MPAEPKPAPLRLFPKQFADPWTGPEPFWGLCLCVCNMREGPEQLAKSPLSLLRPFSCTHRSYLHLHVFLKPNSFAVFVSIDVTFRENISLLKI